MSAEADRVNPHPEWTTHEAVDAARRRKNRAVSMRQLINIDAPHQLRRLVETYDLFPGTIYLPLLKPMEQEELTAITLNDQAKGFSHLIVQMV